MSSNAKNSSGTLAGNQVIGEQITTIFRLEKEGGNKKNLVKVFQYLRAIK